MACRRNNWFPIDRNLSDFLYFSPLQIIPTCSHSQTPRPKPVNFLSCFDTFLSFLYRFQSELEEMYVVMRILFDFGSLYQRIFVFVWDKVQKFIVRLFETPRLEKRAHYLEKLDWIFIPRFFIAKLNVEMAHLTVFRVLGSGSSISVVDSEKVSNLRQTYVLFFLRMNA